MSAALPLRQQRGANGSPDPRFRANLSNGLTAEFDGVIPFGTTGVVVEWRGLTLAIPAPRSFPSLEWEIERREDGGEIVADVLSCYAGDVRLSVIVYVSGMARIDLRRLGRRRFRGPTERGGENGR